MLLPYMDLLHIVLFAIIANAQYTCHLTGQEEYNIGLLNPRPQYCTLKSQKKKKEKVHSNYVALTNRNL